MADLLGSAPARLSERQVHADGVKRDLVRQNLGHIKAIGAMTGRNLGP